MKEFFRKYGLLLVFVVLQLGFWEHYSRHKLPDMGIVPDVPSQTAVRALSFGDEQFYFRLLAWDIQNAGDTYGRFTALYKYDYKKLYAWFTLLDSLDKESDYIPFLASYYFSQTQNIPDIRYVVDYLYEHSKDNPSKNFWWLTQAAYCAEHKLDDRELALKVASPLEHADTAPFWARELPAFIHERRGEMDDAYRIIQNIEAHSKEIPPHELKFMTYFVKERLKRLETLQKKEQ
jgi:hypothetical protein